MIAHIIPQICPISFDKEPPVCFYGSVVQKKLGKQFHGDTPYKNSDSEECSLSQ